MFATGLPLAFAPVISEDWGRPPLLLDIDGDSKNFGLFILFSPPNSIMYPDVPKLDLNGTLPLPPPLQQGTCGSEPAPMLPPSAQDLSLATRQLPVGRTTRQAGRILPTTLTEPSALLGFFGGCAGAHQGARGLSGTTSPGRFGTHPWTPVGVVK